MNNDVIRVDPHIIQYTVYIIDNCTGNITVVKNVTETRFTFDASQDFSCPMYQVSAWNAGGEGELSEPVHGCISHSKLLFFHLLIEGKSREIAPYVANWFFSLPSTSKGGSWQCCYAYNSISSVNYARKCKFPYSELLD